MFGEGVNSEVSRGCSLNGGRLAGGGGATSREGRADLSGERSKGVPLKLRAQADPSLTTLTCVIGTE
jgi:hypothetical protein